MKKGMKVFLPEGTAKLMTKIQCFQTGPESKIEVWKVRFVNKKNVNKTVTRTIKERL